MFTGIVQTKAKVASILGNEAFKTIELHVDNRYLENLAIGASIAINGVCLTVTEYKVSEDETRGRVQFDIIDETLIKTNLGLLKSGDLVNFERSLSFGAELGGHIVSGHIQTTGTVSQIERTEDNLRLSLSVPNVWLKYILSKGFAAINGCSLTIGEVNEEGFDLHLIPETLSITNLGDAQVGDKLNIEVDQQTYTIVQTVERYLTDRENAI